MIQERIEEASLLYDQLAQKHEKKLAELADKVASLQSMVLPVLAISLQEQTETRLAQ